jgi:hypothetical protein
VFAVDRAQLFIGAVDLLAPDRSAIQPPCGARIGAVDPASLSLDRVDVYQVNRETDVATDVVVAMTLGAGAEARLCVMAIHKDNLLTAAVLTDVTPPGATAPASRTLLADLDGNADRCPGLVNPDGGPVALRYWAGQLTGSHCALKAAASAPGDPLPPIREASPGAAVIGRIPVEPAVPFVVGDALVLGDGVYALIPGLASYQALYRTTRTLARVASADLDGDGAVDAVIAARGEAGLDVLMRSTSPPGFQLLRLDTASEATTLTLGDYDGNGITDIAYTEAIGAHQRLMISFGTADRPLAPVEVGEFPSIIAIARLQFPDSIDQLSLAADLVVLQPPSGDLATLTLLHGSPNRTMMPYFDPRSPAARAASGVFGGTVIGQFGAATGAATGAAAPPAHRGIVALAPAHGSATIQAFAVAGTDTGLDAVPSDGVAVTGLADCAGGSTELCLGDAALFAWPSAPGHDAVLAIDHQAAPHAGMFDPAARPISVTLVPALTSKIPANSVLVALHAADLDGDGAVDLVAAFAPGTAADRGAILVCRASGGFPTSCDDVVPAIIAAAPAHARLSRRRAGPPRLSRSMDRAIAGL